MAITIDYVLLPHLRKQDGTNFIRIRVTNQRKSKYIKTNIIIEPEHLTRSGVLKHQGKKDLADNEVKRWREAASKLPHYITDEMELDGIVRCIEAKLAEGKDFRLNFAEYGMRLAKTKKEGTACGYRAAIRCLVRFFGYEPDISEITVRKMREFEDYVRNENVRAYCPAHSKVVTLKKKKKTEAGVSTYASKIRAIYKTARIEFNEPDLGLMRIPYDIYEYYKVPKMPPAEHRNIPMEWVQMMIDQRKGLTGRERKAIDVFLISFGLMGINTIDMFTCEKARNGVIHYFRTKTKDKKDDKAEMYVRIEPCIQKIIKEYKGIERQFDFHLRHNQCRSFIHSLNEGLKQWQTRNKLSNFSFYSARHTWGTIAASKEVGVDYALVTEGLTHSDASRRMDQVYIKKDWERVWDANAKVLGLFDWK